MPGLVFKDADERWQRYVLEFINGERGAQMASNPYDRRDQRLINVAGMAADSHAFAIRGGIVDSPRESPVSFEEIESMVWTARKRGAREERDRALERETEARRQAWDEGHEAGIQAGKRQMLDRIDRSVGSETRATLDAGADVLERYNRDHKSVRKEELAGALLVANRIFQALIDAHHNGFEELPW